MKKIIAVVICVFTFCNCVSKHEKRTSKGNGGIVLGGSLRINEVENINSLMPIAINEINGFHVSSQVYEGLVKYNQSDLSIVPSLATHWEVSADNTEYTFYLRQDVFFQDDSCFEDGVGRELEVSDILYCFERLCSPNRNNVQFDITFKGRVQGANEFYAESIGGKNSGLSGLTIINDTTIKIKLLQPDANFLNILTMPGCYIYPKEAIKLYGKLLEKKAVGTGPFCIKQSNDGNKILMTRNLHYWGYDKKGNQLPYLDTVIWSFIHDKNAEIDEFKEGRLDVIYDLPSDLFQEIMSNLQNSMGKNIYFDVYSSPALSTHYYGFDIQTNPFFSIKEVRKAFNLAIDRKKIIEFVIKGEGTSADYGIVPFTDEFAKSGYAYQNIRGFTFNPDSAKKLLKSVGYAEGKGLPEFNLEINSGGGDRNIMVATAVQQMLKDNIGVKVNINIVSWREHIENVQSGKSDFFRYSWVSDYSDPESFLALFYGKHVPENYLEKSTVNLCRFKNKTFDSLFVAARLQSNKTKRFKLLSQAEQIILDEAAFIPLFYDENFRLEQKTVQNFPENSLNYMDMREIWLKPKN